MSSADTPRPSPTAEQRLLDKLLREKYEPVAIVGMGLRFPGGNESPQAFAEFLRAGQDGTGPIPPDRWDVAGLATPEAKAPGRIRTEGGGFLDGIDQFDARFFNIAPKEANVVDPQHRLVLECAWRALEHANIDPQSLKDSDAGVYIGISCVDYLLEVESLSYEQLDGHIGTGTSHSSAAGRLSFFLGLRGPCVALDTACSSSLVSLHLAVQGLRRGECSLALAGGVSAVHHPRHHIIFTQANMLAPDGRCKTFDERADGYGRSEGCGVLVLKRLSDALKDGDQVLALVRGSAIAQDGESAGLTVPNGSAQEMVMRRALDSAMLRPADIQYVEAHGTGTPLGDPIEIGGIHGVFGASHPPEAPVIVGSVKTNLGHMEAAAGVGGIVKTVLQLQAGEIFPHLHFETPSSRIPWDRYAVKVPTQPQAWPGKTRRALVNSFGFSGIIASVLLEQAPASGAAASTLPAPAPGEPQLFTLSAKTRPALLALVRAHRSRIEQDDRQGGPSLAEWCRASRMGRAHLSHRMAGVVRDWPELDALLEDAEATLQDETEPAPRAPVRVAWLFTGQGSQAVGMGRALYQRFPAFREQVDACDALFQPLLQRSIRALMFGELPGSAELLNQTAFTQPALFTLEYAQARLWASFGIEASVLVGHSIGELVAATVAGVFSLEDAVRVVAERGRLMQSVQAPGGMLAVSAAPQQVSPLMHGLADLAFAAFNAPSQCVVSGGLGSLEQVRAALQAQGMASRMLPVSHAFHSPLMHEVFPAFRQVFEGMVLNEPQVTVMSNLTGATATARELRSPDYWVRHIGEPVRFTAGMQGVAARGRHVFIELGPAPVLTALGRQCIPAREHLWLAGPAAGDTHVGKLLEALAELYLSGASIRWAAVDAGQPRPHLQLPLYPFERRRHWLPVARRHAASQAAALAASPAAPAGHPLLGLPDPGAAGPAGAHHFMQRISARQPAYLADHVLAGQVIFPGAGYVELMLALQDAVFGETRHEVIGLAIHEPLLLRDDALTQLRTTLSPDDDGKASTWQVEITSLAEGLAGAVPRRHASARLRLATGEAQTAGETLARELEAEAESAGPARATLEAPGLFEDYRAMGLAYGPSFQHLQRIDQLGGRLVAGWLTAAAAGPELLPPALLDGAFQSMLGLLDTELTYLPVAFDRLNLAKKPRGPVHCLVRRVQGVPGQDATLRFDLALFESTGEQRLVFSLHGLTLQQATGAARRPIHTLAWRKRSLPAAAARGTAARHGLVIGLAGAALAALREAAEAPLVLHAAESLDAVADLLRAQPAITELAWFWQPLPAAGALEALQAETRTHLPALLALAHRLEREFFDRKLRLWLVTTGGVVLPQDPAPDPQRPPVAATAWGLGAVWLTEQPRLRVTLLDLDPAAGPTAAAALLQEWQAADSAAEPRIAWRAGHRHVLRVAAPRDPAPGNFRLAVREPGGLAHVGPEPVADVPPGPGEATVEMRAAGLNFKDVLNALGMLKQHAESTGQPYHPLPLGFEGAGVVTAVGEGTGLAVGDEVIVNHLGCMQRRVTLPALALVKKPPALSFEQAAGLPAAYVTAAYALNTLAGLRAGDKVLIHAAAGGVGQAAVHLARQAGAEIFATASPRKWPLLRSQGVQHVMNSRSLDFAEDIRRLTAGRGVDVVLNSLNKDFIPAGLGVLAPGGRFVELGKVGVWSPAEVQALRPDVAYHNFDLSEFEPQALLQLNHELMSRVVADVAAGRLPPLPCTAYSLDEVEEAFSVLSRGANTGKLVLAFEPPPAPLPPGRAIDPAASHVVTGGFGALGEWTARCLAGMGARHLVLVGRRAPAGPELQALQARLPGVLTLEAVAADVAEPADVDRLEALLRASGRPLGAVVHAAGVLQDKPLASQDAASFEAVLRPKVQGAWLLHRMASRLPGPGLLVSYSSVAAVVGSAGQANYAAANAFLDQLAAWRAAQGLPSLSVDWGPFAEVGMAARLEAAQAAAVEAKGFAFIRPREGMRSLRQLWRSATVQAVVGEVDWARVAGSLPAGAALYAEVARGPAASGPARVDTAELARLPRGEQAARLNRLIRQCLAGLLHFEGADDISPEAPFAEVGLDSLEGVELANQLEAALDVPLPGSVTFDAPSVPQLTELLLKSLAQRQASPSEA